MDIDKLFRGLLGVGGLSTNLISSILGYRANQANIKQQKEANEKNIALQRETNTMQMAEAEKAYQRSKPTTQVSNLMATGMSRAGALGAITGAGTYTPPSLNTAQVEPVKSDPSAMLEALGDLSSNAMQYRMSKEQLETQRKQIEAQQKIAADNNKTQLEVANIQAGASKYGSDNSLKGTVYSSDKEYDARMKQIESDYRIAIERIGVAKDELAEKVRQFDLLLPYQREIMSRQAQHLAAQTNLDDARRQQILAETEEWLSSPFKTARQAEALLKSAIADYDEKRVKYELAKFVEATGCHYDEDGNIKFSNYRVAKHAWLENEAGKMTQGLFKALGVKEFGMLALAFKHL